MLIGNVLTIDFKALKITKVSRHQNESKLNLKKLKNLKTLTVELIVIKCFVIVVNFSRNFICLQNIFYFRRNIDYNQNLFYFRRNN